MAILKNKDKPKNQKKPDYEQLGKMLQNIYDSGYIDKNAAYKMSFLKGIAAGFGGVIGATIVVALLIWILSLFDNIPLIGPLTDNIQNTVETKKTP